MPEKKIALVIPSLHAGGMERVMSELAAFFATEKKANVHVILLGITERFYILPPEVTIHEPSFPFNNKKPLWNTIKTMLFLRKKIKELKPDTVLSFGEMYNSFVLVSTVFTSFKIFVSDRSKPDKNWGRFHHLLRKVFYRRATGIISQTNFASEVMQKRLSHSNIKTIGNPIKPVENGMPVERKNIILTVGRMIKSKRMDLLIKLFSKTKNENWQLHILGDGPERQRLELLVTEMQLQDKVIFLGTQKKVIPYYASAKIFAFTSNSEGFPNVLGEAMSAGLAPISFNFVAGAGDLIENDVNGFLIPMDNESLYIEKLNSLMENSNQAEQFAAAAKNTVKKFDIYVIANEYYSFLLS